jgi:phage host-nuclease inhibitor protein Gam
MAKPRLKSPAQTTVPQTRDDAAADIRKIGDLQRQKLREQAEMNDAIAHITASYQPRLDAVNAQIVTLQQGVQSWCEANRDELTQGGKIKTANLVTGEIQWRQRPPSVRLAKLDSVLFALAQHGLQQFIRSKAEVNKDAILANPEKVRGIAGISIVTGVEDFVITPFEQEAA